MKVAYRGSTYTDDYSFYTVQNPFCPTGAVDSTCARNSSVSSPTALMSLWPSNQANGMSTTMGVINTLLSNNVITAQLTPELKFKASYRYDNFDNGTPEIRFADWVLTDAASAKANTNSYAPVQTLSISYMRQNAGMEPGRGLQMGALRLGTCRRLRHQPSGTLLCLRLLPAQALSGMVVGLAAAVVVVNAKKL